MAFINSGTSIGEASVHLVIASGIKKDIKIIAINMVVMSGSPVNSRLLINEINHEAMTVPKLVQFKILTSKEAKNINMNI